MNILRFLIPKSRVACLEEDATLRNGLEKMRHHGYTAMPVISKNGVYIGTVTEGDFLWHLLKMGTYTPKELEKQQVSALIRPGWNPPAAASETVSVVFEHLKEQNFVPVVDDRGVFVGIVTRRAILEHCTVSEGERKPHPIHRFEKI